MSPTAVVSESVVSPTAVVSESVVSQTSILSERVSVHDLDRAVQRYADLLYCWNIKVKYLEVNANI